MVGNEERERIGLEKIGYRGVRCQRAAACPIYLREVTMTSKSRKNAVVASRALETQQYMYVNCGLAKESF